ncbi:hypothetical protein B0T17DRAFT_646469 [Bombardia bombarda]|uniref:Lipocalin-like domain-containing protein n=1 Tax=Bombardia bombarda TaxID=252184 RepID=A0AA39WGQ5_9PEZI|nr:hypothetical protein B0T17DRAFT_646469 [Bombardia bombarda]
MKYQHILNAIAGAYSLVNTTVLLDGVVQPPSSDWGSSSHGTLVYTATGYVSVVITTLVPELRPVNVTWPPRTGQTDADWLLVGRHSLSYSGHMSISDDVPYARIPPTKKSGTVLHGPIIVSPVNSLEDTVMERNYTVLEAKGDGLYLKIDFHTRSVESILWWKKMD